jgi:hypothetical protein
MIPMYEYCEHDAVHETMLHISVCLVISVFSEQFISLHMLSVEKHHISKYCQQILVLNFSNFFIVYVWLIAKFLGSRVSSVMSDLGVLSVVVILSLLIHHLISKYQPEVADKVLTAFFMKLMHSPHI